MNYNIADYWVRPLAFYRILQNTAFFCYVPGMHERPLAVTIIACLLIAVGILGGIFHTKEIISQGSFNFPSIWIPAVSLLAAIAGIFILLGRNWARWLALVWMAGHVAISFFDSWQEVTMHAVIFLLIAYILLGSAAGAYFRRPAAS